MAVRIRKAEYFHATVRDVPGEGYRFLTVLSEAGVNLLAFSAIPVGPEHTQLVLFAEDAANLKRIAQESQTSLVGPQHALLVQGDDELGALAGIHRKLAEAGVNVFASNGVTDGRGGYGYVLYVRPGDMDQAAKALGAVAVEDQYPEPALEELVGGGEPGEPAAGDDHVGLIGVRHRSSGGCRSSPYDTRALASVVLSGG